MSETERNLLDLSHRQVLADHNIDILEIKGDWVERFEKSVVQINKLVASIKVSAWLTVKCFETATLG